MRKYIGNITIYNSQKVESDPAREALRLELIESDKAKYTKNVVDRHLDYIQGTADLSELIIWFLDDEGRLPANMPIESIKIKYGVLNGQLKWMKALIKEMYNKLDALDPERAETDRQEREKLESDYEADIDKIYKENIENKAELPPELFMVICKVLRAKRLAPQLKKAWDNKISDMRIVGVGRVATAIRYLFADYINKPELQVTDDVNARYDMIKKEAEWLSIVTTDLEAKLIDLREMVYAYESL